jgi:nucleotidyltransferase/DNA polymerase involved in DNA repair
VAKIASDHQKPDGLTVVTAKRAEQFLAPLLVKAIPGIGPKAAQALRALGAESISDARRFSWEELERRFGSQGLSLWERFRGIDERPIAAEAPERKSIGKHFTFDTDTHDMEEVLAVIKEQANEIMDTLKRKSFRSFKTVVVTVRFTDFTTNTRSLTLDAPANSARSIILTATKLLFPFFEKSGNPEGKAIRLVGVRIEKLV